MEEQKRPTCKRCGAEKTDSQGEFLDNADKMCFAHKSDSVAYRICQTRAILQLVRMARSGWEGLRVVAVAHNLHASEEAANRALDLITMIEHGQIELQAINGG